MLVMIADDSFSMRSIIKDMLIKLGYRHFLEANDGREVIMKINSSRENVSLLLLDIDMPKLDGKSVLRILKKAKRTQNIPIIMVTGNKNKDTVLECLKLGASAYLTKPFSWKILEEKINEALEKMEQQILEQEIQEREAQKKESQEQQTQEQQIQKKESQEQQTQEQQIQKKESQEQQIQEQQIQKKESQEQQIQEQQITYETTEVSHPITGEEAEERL